MDDDLFCLKSNTSSHTLGHWFQARLMKLLQDANAPLYLYEDIIKWARDANAAGLMFNNISWNRKSTITNLQQLLNIENCAPILKTIVLPYTDELKIDITTFDFETMLRSLLMDSHLISDINNFDVDVQNPFSKYTNEDKRLSVVNSGSWYNNAYNHCITDPSSEMLVPICFACDKTQIKKSGKASCWPLLFSTTLFNQNIRNKSIAWRPLGYILILQSI